MHTITFQWFDGAEWHKAIFLRVRRFDTYPDGMLVFVDADHDYRVFDNVRQVTCETR